MEERRATLAYRHLSRALQATVCLLACLAVQGCIGGWIQTRNAHTIETPSVGDKPSPNFHLAIGKGKPGESPTSDWLLEHWGQPTTIRRASKPGQKEVWVYKCGRVWYGAIPCVIVPIPLVLPLESRKVKFVLRDGRVVRATAVEFSNKIGWLAGLGPGGFGAGPF
jgi:hypothetical protein